MGQNLSSENCQTNESRKFEEKGSFIDELIGGTTSPSNKEQNSAKTKKQIYKVDNIVEMIVTKKLITTTTTTTPSVHLAQTLVVDEPNNNNQTSECSNLIDGSIQLKSPQLTSSSSSTVIKKEQLEYEFHIKPPKSKKSTKKKSKKRVIAEPSSSSRESGDVVRNSSFLNFLTSCVNTRNNTDTDEANKNNRKANGNSCGCFRKFSNLQNENGGLSNSNLSKDGNINNATKLLEFHQSPVKLRTKNNSSLKSNNKKIDDDDYTDPPPVRCIRVLRPSNDLTPVQFDSHYNIIQALNGSLNVNGDSINIGVDNAADATTTTTTTTIVDNNNNNADLITSK